MKPYHLKQTRWDGSPYSRYFLHFETAKRAFDREVFEAKRSAALYGESVVEVDYHKEFDRHRMVARINALPLGLIHWQVELVPLQTDDHLFP